MAKLSAIHLRDYLLGSIVELNSANGKVIERFSYDAWGKRRQYSGAKGCNISSPRILHGFTGHEILVEMDLVHINGWVHDSPIGRFALRVVWGQYATNSQSYNRYTYVMSTPLRRQTQAGKYRKCMNKIRQLVK